MSSWTVLNVIYIYLWIVGQTSVSYRSTRRSCLWSKVNVLVCFCKAFIFITKSTGWDSELVGSHGCLPTRINASIAVRCSYISLFFSMPFEESGWDFNESDSVLVALLRISVTPPPPPIKKERKKNEFLHLIIISFTLKCSSVSSGKLPLQVSPSSLGQRSRTGSISWMSMVSAWMWHPGSRSWGRQSRAGWRSRQGWPGPRHRTQLWNGTCRYLRELSSVSIP